jgi:hypothetical protein
MSKEQGVTRLRRKLSGHQLAYSHVTGRLLSFPVPAPSAVTNDVGKPLVLALWAPSEPPDTRLGGEEKRKRST